MSRPLRIARLSSALSKTRRSYRQFEGLAAKQRQDRVIKRTRQKNAASLGAGSQLLEDADQGIVAEGAVQEVALAAAGFFFAERSEKERNGVPSRESSNGARESEAATGRHRKPRPGNSRRVELLVRRTPARPAEGR